MVARAQMRSDNEFILELIATIDKIVQVHVAEFVDLFFAVLGRNKRHFTDQHLGFVHDGAIVEA